MIYTQEMFYSLQGEGPRAGAPSVFVRTGLCNFSCKGFGVQYQVNGETRYGCDTFYAVDKDYKNKWNVYVTSQDLIKDINKCIPDFDEDSILKPDIVFTGGEPLLYWNDTNYQKVLAYYISRGHKVTIETNGSLDINFTREYQKKIMFSTSVKLAVSAEPKHKRINLDTLTKIAENTNSYLKFVSSKKTFNDDFREIKEILNDLPVYIDVYLMPLGEVSHVLEENAKFIFTKAMQYGFHYTDRLHIRIFEDEVGV